MDGGGIGKIKRLHRSLGIGTITPDTGGEEIIFPAGAVYGGKAGFGNLKEGDSVNYRLYPEQIHSTSFAEDVWPI